MAKGIQLEVGRTKVRCKICDKEGHNSRTCREKAGKQGDDNKSQEGGTTNKYVQSINKGGAKVCEAQHAPRTFSRTAPQPPKAPFLGQHQGLPSMHPGQYRRDPQMHPMHHQSQHSMHLSQQPSNLQRHLLRINLLWTTFCLWVVKKLFLVWSRVFVNNCLM